MTRAMDVRDEEAVKSLYAEVEREFGTVDVLVNNAGAGTSTLGIRDIDAKDFWYDFVSVTELADFEGRPR